MPICSRCHAEYVRTDGGAAPGAASGREGACRYHCAEFVCRPHPPDHYAFELNDDMYARLQEKNWPAKFWDCCGAEDRDAPGCATGPHVPYD